MSETGTDPEVGGVAETPRQRWTLWPRFRLLTLLIVGPLLAICVSFFVIQWRRAELAKRAIEEIVKQGGVRVVDKQQRVIRIYLRELTDEKLRKLLPHLTNLPYLRELDIVDSKLTDKSLERLAKLSQIQTLYLHRSGLSKASLATLRARRPGWDIRTSKPSPIAMQLAAREIFLHAVVSVAFSPSGHQLATGSGDGVVRLWRDEPARGRVRLERSLPAHTDWAFSTVYSPDGRWLATAGGDDLIKVWSLKRGECVRQLAGHDDDVHGVRFLPDGRLASVSDDHTLRIWNWQQGRQLVEVEAHDSTIPALDASADGTLIATGGRDDRIRIWDASTGELQRELLGHEGDVLCVAFDRRGERLASASYDKSIRVWSVTDGRLIRSYRSHRDWAFSVCFSADGERLVSGGGDGIRIWDLASGRLLFAGEKPANISRLAPHPTGSLVAAASAEGNVALWDVGVGALARSFWTRFGERGLPVELGR